MNSPVNAGIAAHIGTYSDGVCHSADARVLHTSGTPGLDDGGSLPADFTAQAELAWANILKILAEAGMDTGDIVKVNQFLTRQEDLPAYRAIRSRALGAARPASTLLFVPALVWPEMLIEVEIIAAK